METSKHHADAYVKVSEYIETLPPWSKKIGERLREIIFKSDPAVVENWKWGPNYSVEGMVCGFSAFKKHVNLVFFQGALLRDKYNLLISNPTNEHNRHMRFTDVKEVKEDIILEYIAEAITNNREGKKVLQADDKTIVIAPDVQREFKAGGVLNYFNSLSYSHRKEFINCIAEAKKDETRKSRILKAVSMLAEKGTLNETKKDE